MLHKLFFLVAFILFVLAALGADVRHLVEWGLAALALGFLLEGYLSDLGRR